MSLDGKVSKWLPDIPNADRVTLGQLAQMTSGYRRLRPEASPHQNARSWSSWA